MSTRINSMERRTTMRERTYTFFPLTGIREQGGQSIFKAGNTLTQRVYRTSYNEVITKIDIRGMADGQKAGLCRYATLNVVREQRVCYLEFNMDGMITKGPVLTGHDLWLKSTWGWMAKAVITTA